MVPNRSSTPLSGLRLQVVALLAVVLAPGVVVGQRVGGIPESLVRQVMPEAVRFSDVAGDPPVITGYAAAEGDEVLGFVFLTSDLPPEQYGYSGPIEVLVGMRLDGSLTGVRVTDYNESYRSQMGDFLRTPGFQEQFAEKHIRDPFQLWGDIEGISRVSISVRAMSRGVRDSARRVAAAYGGAPDAAVAAEVVDPVGLSWFDLRQRGFVERFEVTEPGEGSAGISLAWISNDRLGEYYFGTQLYERAQRSAERRGGAENLLLYAIDGSRLRLFRQEGWSIEQDGVSTPIESANVVSMGLPSGGIVSGEATMVGLMLVGSEVDMARPFNFQYDLGELGTHTVEYVSQEARIAAAEELAAAELAAAERAALEAAAAAEASAAAEAAAEAEVSQGSPEGDGEEPATSGGIAGGSGTAASTGAEGESTGEAPGTEADIVAAPNADLDEAEPVASDAQNLDFVLTEDETFLQRTFAGTSWGRVALMLVVITLGLAAFFTKGAPLRWVALSATLFGLGFADGGFLSVSHITSGIWAGVGVYLRDLPLLILVVVTVVTTLIWGRVFCGFLCPFGALQDFIEKVVPRSWQKPLPAIIHDRAVWVKYAVLAVVVLPAILGSRTSLYQYFEPFGTVFFQSPSILLWAIALLFLGASVVVPRFYCRYACPLGASLGLLSLVSLRRIERVEQCNHCKVCEQRCPTGAIRGPEVDFKECVRCNECEILLIEKAGVCQHDMADIRPRLVQLKTSGSAVDA